jgi:uncharacterized SAM-binding protein YcdF (DUF218 family)
MASPTKAFHTIFNKIAKRMEAKKYFTVQGKFLYKLNYSFRYWKSTKCKGKLITNNYSSAEDLQIIETTTHNGHTGNPIKIANRQVDHRVRTLAATTQETTRNITQQAVERLPTEEAKIVLVTRRPKNTTRNIQRQRQAIRNEPEIPTTAFFEIPDEIRTMENGENFILGDWNSDEDRILLMGKDHFN